MGWGLLYDYSYRACIEPSIINTVVHRSCICATAAGVSNLTDSTDSTCNQGWRKQMHQ